MLVARRRVAAAASPAADAVVGVGRWADMAGPAHVVPDTMTA